MKPVHMWVLVARDPWAQQTRIRAVCGFVARLPYEAFTQLLWPEPSDVTCQKCIEQDGIDHMEGEE